MTNSAKRKATMKDIAAAKAIMGQYEEHEYWKTRYQKALATVKIREAQLARLDRISARHTTTSNN
jgi:hypothetical protein